MHRPNLTSPAHENEAVQNGAAAVGAIPPELDYSRIAAFWGRVTPSMLGPYMMEGFGFPADAGRFRFRRERETVARIIEGVPSTCSVLDLGSGVGFWTEYFSRRFAAVVSVEASPALYSALADRCSRRQNVSAHNADVLSFEPEAKFGLVFLGGLLMYLNEDDVRALLKRLRPSLEPGALVLCRESTIRQGTKVLRDQYQVVYRSVETYVGLFAEAGFDVVSAGANSAYVGPQMASELVKKWKARVPEPYWCLPAVGRLSYWAFRIGYPWNTTVIPRLFAQIGWEFPFLTNHFFVLRARGAAEPARGNL